MANLGLICNSIGAMLFLFLFCLLLINWKGKLVSFLLSISAFVSAVWFAAVAWHAINGPVSLNMLRILEFARDLSWLSLLILVIRYGSGDRQLQRTDKQFIFLFLAFVSMFFVIVLTNQFFRFIELESLGGLSNLYFFYLVLALFGLLLVEKLYQNTAVGQKWNIRYFCLGIGGIFIYDFFLYSDAMLLKSINPDLWYARGLINALCVPLIVVSIVRNPHWEANLFVSRHVVYRSIVVIAAGIYLSVMAAAGYYVREYGGTWGSSLQITFFFGAIIILIVVIFSNQFRSTLKVTLAKHFYKNKYDYREEWLKFTSTLAEEVPKGEEYTHVIRTIAGIINCKGGAIWLHDPQTEMYSLVKTWSDFPNLNLRLTNEDDLIAFLEQKKWILDIKEYLASPEKYEHIYIDDQLTGIKNLKLILPLIYNDSLIGFITLSSEDNKIINWEDADLLKTMANQSASYIALLRANEQLTEAKQFEAFNRLSAYVVHDIKNLVAQLSLVSANAIKFRDNPEFVDDAFETIENATSKMKRMLKSLSKQELDRVGNQIRLNVISTINSVIENRAGDLPVPKLEFNQGDIYVSADADKFASVIEHIVQNAQEATADDGEILIRAGRENGQVYIVIEDTGCGMTEEFLQHHLFKPFDTTKGNAGMGIGVYESRDIIRNMNGKLDVESAPEKGTCFTITLPELNN